MQRGQCMRRRRSSSTRARMQAMQQRPSSSSSSHMLASQLRTPSLRCSRARGVTRGKDDKCVSDAHAGGMQLCRPRCLRIVEFHIEWLTLTMGDSHDVKKHHQRLWLMASSVLCSAGMGVFRKP